MNLTDSLEDLLRKQGATKITLLIGPSGGAGIACEQHITNKTGHQTVIIHQAEAPDFAQAMEEIKANVNHCYEMQAKLTVLGNGGKITGLR